MAVTGIQALPMLNGTQVSAPGTSISPLANVLLSSPDLLQAQNQLGLGQSYMQDAMAQTPTRPLGGLARVLAGGLGAYLTGNAQSTFGKAQGDVQGELSRIVGGAGDGTIANPTLAMLQSSNPSVRAMAMAQLPKFMDTAITTGGAVNQHAGEKKIDVQNAGQLAQNTAQGTANVQMQTAGPIAQTEQAGKNAANLQTAPAMAAAEHSADLVDTTLRAPDGTMVDVKLPRGQYQQMLGQQFPGMAGAAPTSPVQSGSPPPLQATGGPGAPTSGSPTLGPSPNFAPMVAQAESGGDPNAQNQKSSATGPQQFVDGTWLSMMKQNRPDLAAGKTDQQILAMRGDRGLSDAMTNAYATQNASQLAAARVPVNDANLYVAHVWGGGGASKLLTADPSQPAAGLVATPGSVDPNSGIKNLANNRLPPNVTAGDVVRATIDRFSPRLPGDPAESPPPASVPPVQIASSLPGSGGAPMSDATGNAPATKLQGPVPAQPPQGMMLGKPVSAPGMADATGDMIKGDYQQVVAGRTAAASAQKEQATLKTIQDFLPTVAGGWGSQQRQDAARILKGLGVSDADAQSVTGNSAVGGQILTHKFLELTAQATRAQGAREPGSVMMLFKNSYPNLENDPQANLLQTNAMYMDAARAQDEASAKEQAFQSGLGAYQQGSGGQTYKGLSGFQQQFDTSNPATDYMHAGEAMSGLKQGWGSAKSQQQQDAIYSRIPSGSIFIGPDGVKRVKP